MTADPGRDRPHLLPLPGTEWSCWRWGVLRSPGFPAELVLRLAAPSLVERCDEVDALEAAMSVERAHLVELLEGSQSQPGHSSATKNALRKSLARLRRGELEARLDRLVDAELIASESAARFVARADALREAAKRLASAYEAQAHETTRRLVAIASEPRFGDALLWQNPAAYRTALLRLRRGIEKASDRRQSEQLVASYLQRYALKNDTIGFFGPCADLEMADAGPPLEVRVGSRLVRRREVFLETWALDELAATLARRPEVRPHLCPRRNPGVRLRDGVLYVPTQLPVPLSPPQQALFEAADGTRSARQIAEALAERDFGTAEALLAQLEQLAMVRVVEWGFHLPADPDASAIFAEQIESIEDPAARDRCREALSELERARAEVAASVDEHERLRAALAAIEETFEALTGRRAARKHGGVYAARTIVFEDCRRDLDVMLGPAVRERLAAPLDLVLCSARWFTDRLMAVVNRAAEHSVRRMLAEAEPGARARVPVLDVYDRMGRETDWGSEIDAIEEELAKKWWTDVFAPVEGSRLDVDSAAVRDRVHATFESAPGWQLGRYHSPDVMIAAPSAAAACAGEFRLVLGEVHAGFHSIRPNVFHRLTPFDRELREALSRDMSRRHIEILPPKTADGVTTRTSFAFFSEAAVLVSTPGGTLVRRGRDPVPIAGVHVFDEAGEIRVSIEGAEGSIPIGEALGSLAAQATALTFAPFGFQTHRPRITIDGMIVAREAWRFPAAELSFAFETDAGLRFAGARRWMRASGVPRHAFYRSPVELKPCYLDLDAPVFVELFAKTVRAAAAFSPSASIKVEEMVPSFDELWLPGPGGELYTSELRLVVLDAREPRAR